VNKIVKDNNLEYVSEENVSAEDINFFRKIFRNHPEIESQVNKLVETYEHSAVELFNSFLAEAAKYKIYKDEDLSYVREFRVYLSKRNIGFNDEEYS
jgi:hemoglobin-like flavoprotein